MKQAEVAGCTYVVHYVNDNKDTATYHETITTTSRFRDWLLWVLVFTNITIDIVTDITTGIGVVIAIDIGTVINIYVDRVVCNMVNK